jgi:hypothetical protein
MTVYSWIIVGLALFDLMLLAFLYRFLQTQSSKSIRGMLIPVAGGMAAFGFHAFMFFTGAFLFLQLATYSAMFGLYLWKSGKRGAPLA